MKVKIGQLLYYPSHELKVIEVMGRNYAGSLNGPNVFVVSDIDKMESDINFSIDQIDYKLNGCDYEEVDGNIHIQCKNWKMEYKG